MYSNAKIRNRHHNARTKAIMQNRNDKDSNSKCNHGGKNTSHSPPPPSSLSSSPSPPYGLGVLRSTDLSSGKPFSRRTRLIISSARSEMPDSVAAWPGSQTRRWARSASSSRRIPPFMTLVPLNSGTMMRRIRRGPKAVSCITNSGAGVCTSGAGLETFVVFGLAELAEWQKMRYQLLNHSIARAMHRRVEVVDVPDGACVRSILIYGKIRRQLHWKSCETKSWMASPAARIASVDFFEGWESWALYSGTTGPCSEPEAATDASVLP